MNHAVEPYDGSLPGQPRELPALLVAGGSCSRLCRSARPAAALNVADDPVRSHGDDTSMALHSAD